MIDIVRFVRTNKAKLLDYLNLPLLTVRTIRVFTRVYSLLLQLLVC
jgi:hypothetical protein